MSEAILDHAYILFSIFIGHFVISIMMLIVHRLILIPV
jgi:hypothetical protein